MINHMHRYHHYIWDFDGTLFDSYPHSTRALYVTARHYGAEVTYDEVSRAIRHSFARMLSSCRVPSSRRKSANKFTVISTSI